MDNKPAISLAAKALEIALSQNGVTEKPKGSNGGPEVNQYLKSIGLGAGYPWCMAFVYWCVNKAASELELKNPLMKTGGVQMQWEHTTLRKLPNRTAGVKPGDIFIMIFSHGTGHTGFVERIEHGIAYTIEGNTNDNGEREGYEVAKRARPLNSLKGFIQL